MAAAVWGEAMPDAWDDALSVLVSRLRRSLRPVTGPCPEPAIKGATVSNQNKPAKMETGLTVQVPPFIEVGTKILIDTRENKYLSRA